MYILLGALYYLLYVIANIGLAVLLPLGIIFRAIPFLRGIGGTLIALGIGASIIFPVMLLAVNNTITSYFVPTLQAPGPPSTCSQSGLNGGTQWLCTFFSQVISTVFNPLASIALASFGTVQYAGSGTNCAGGTYRNPAYDGFNAGENVLFSGSMPILNVMFYYLTPLMFDFILLIFDLILGYAVVQGIAKLLGGSVRLGFGKMSVA